MPSEKKQPPENRSGRSLNKLLNDPGSPPWNFSRIQEGEATTHTSSATYNQADAKGKTKFGRDAKLQDCSSTSFAGRQRRLTETLDITDHISTTRAAGHSRSSMFTEGSSYKNCPVVYVDDDGDFIEETGANVIQPDQCIRSLIWSPTTGVSDQNQSHIQLPKPTPPVAEGCLPPRSRVSFSQIQNRRAEIVPASQNSKFFRVASCLGSTDEPISRSFPVLEFNPGDCMTDGELAQHLERQTFPPPQEINEDDEAVVEDSVPEEDIIDHLGSLVTSAPEEPLSESKRTTPEERKSEIYVFEDRGETLQKGVTVELHNGSFLRIDSVWENSWRLVTIKGYRLARDGYCGRRLPDGRLNELVWINIMDQEEHRAGLESVLCEEPLANVKKVRKVIFTNCRWPNVSFQNALEEGGWGNATLDVASVRDNGTLYCRWKDVQVKSKLKTHVEASIALLNEEEASSIGRFKASEVRRTWQGGRDPIPGGSSTKPVENIDTGETTTLRRYTLGDCFCGAGGISRGAIQAGLQVKWGFDSEGHAIATHKRNFQTYGTESFDMTDAVFIDLVGAMPEDLKVDIAHYSPPCQAFSSANHNKNLARDAVNQRALFSVFHLTERLKPRVATVEETAGLMHRHEEWFDALVNMFTSIGYSVRWRLVRCQDFGIAQSRIRLLLMAAAPGEKLPRFPKPTHGDVGFGLKPYVKVGEAIANIPTWATNQAEMSVPRKPELLQAFSPDSFAKCITTTGGQHNNHFSGTRNYNARELARLQSFPDDHVFSSGIGPAKKEIGNAVPPKLCKPWFETIIKSLRETDGIES